MTTTEKREYVREKLYTMSLTHEGAKRIAQYFIETTSWNKLLEAYKDLK